MEAADSAGFGGSVPGAALQLVDGGFAFAARSPAGRYEVANLDTNRCE